MSTLRAGPQWYAGLTSSAEMLYKSVTMRRPSKRQWLIILVVVWVAIAFGRTACAYDEIATTEPARPAALTTEQVLGMSEDEYIEYMLGTREEYIAERLGSQPSGWSMAREFGLNLVPVYAAATSTTAVGIIGNVALDVLWLIALAITVRLLARTSHRQDKGLMVRSSHTSRSA